MSPVWLLLAAGTLWHLCIIAAVYRLDLGTKHQRRSDEFQYE